ncbi:MAG: polysaccharide biosynthesis protein [Chitinivibrionia bacterium]|nr:polysaccharide biosynthesis protein [Chitinivibrionia bacterium]
MLDNRTDNLDANWRILRDTAILSGAGSLFTLIKPLRTVILGRVLGPHDYGLFNVPLPYVQLLSTFANLGFSAALLRLLALKLGRNDPAGARAMYRIGLLITFASSIVWSLILAVLSPLLAERFASEQRAVLLIAAGAWMIPGITMMAVLSNVYLAFERSPLLGVVKSIYSLLGFVIPVAFVLMFRQPLHVVVSFVLVETAGALIAFWYLERRAIRGLPSESGRAGADLGPLVRLAHSFFYANLGWMIINSIDRIMIQWYCPAEVLGFYAVGVFFVNFLNIIPMNFAQVITPALTKSLARNEIEIAWATIRQTTRIVSLILAPLVVFLSVFADEIVVVLYSDAFAPAGLFVRLLAAIAVLNYVCKLSWSIIVSDADPGKRSAVYIIAAAINIALNFLLIPRFGGTGAACASLLSFAVLSAALQVMLRFKTGRILPFGQIAVPILLAGVSVPVYLLLDIAGTMPKLLAGLSLSTALYIILCARTGALRASDLRHAVERAASLPRPMRTTIEACAKFMERIARS